MKLKILSILMIFIFILNFCSCNEKTSKDKYIRYPISADPICLDPQIATSNSALLTLSSCMEGLVRINENDEIVPAIAKTWSFDADSCEYTFNLRNDCNWFLTNNIRKNLGDDFNSNITAHDFVFALQRAVSAQTNAPDANKLFSIKNASYINSGALNSNNLGVVAVDDYTLKIKLNSPDTNFLYVLASNIALPCNEEFFNWTAGRYGLSTDMLLSNGPFYLSKWTKETSVALRRNTSYTSGNLCSPLAVYLFVNDDENKKITSLLEGSYDAIPISKSNLSKVEKDGINIDYYTDTTWVLGFNFSVPYLNNDNIRKALCQSIEPELLKEKGFEINASGLIPPDLNVYGENYNYENTKLIEKNLENAKTFYKLGLEELETDNINSLKVLCTDDLQTRQFISNIIQHWQKNLGIYFDLQAVPQEEFNSKINSGDYDLAYYPIKANSIDIIDYIKNFSNENDNNPQGYNSIDLKNLINKISSIYDINSLISTVNEAENFLLQNAVVYPIKFEKTYYATAVGVSGITFKFYNGNVSFENAQRLD